jgi:hypothetical protein
VLAGELDAVAGGARRLLADTHQLVDQIRPGRADDYDLAGTCSDGGARHRRQQRPSRDSDAGLVGTAEPGCPAASQHDGPDLPGRP